MFTGYKESLDEQFESELSGEFRLLMRSLVAGERDQNQTVDAPKAKTDAQVRRRRKQNLKTHTHTCTLFPFFPCSPLPAFILTFLLLLYPSFPPTLPPQIRKKYKKIHTLFFPPCLSLPAFILNFLLFLLQFLYLSFPSFYPPPSVVVRCWSGKQDRG